MVAKSALRIPALVPSPLPSTNGLRREDEFELLCLLAGATLAPERVERIANWDFGTLDWNEFIPLAEHHGVLPLAASNLIKHRSVESGRGLPLEIERSLRSAYEANLRRGLWFSAELARVMQHFDQSQVRALPYKGPVLAQSVYRDVALRSFSDLDFLIFPSDFERAKQALAEVGYHPNVELTPAIERLWLRIGYERSFDGAAGKNLVELQWNVLPYFYAVDVHRAGVSTEDMRIDGLLRSAGRALVGGREVPCLSPEDSLLVLCLHAAKHLWTRLIWLCDIAETVRLPTIDYALLFSRAQKLGINRIMAISFWLVKNVLHGELPAPVTVMTAADPQVAVLGEEFAQRLERGAVYDFESTDYFRLIMKLRERRSDRWRYLWRLVWTPGAGDVAAVRLPETLFPLYRILRIGRLTQRFIWSRL